MTRTETSTGAIEYRAKGTDKGAIVHPWDGNHTIFGRWEGGEFVCCSYAKRSKKYASAKSAERQVSRWLKS